MFIILVYFINKPARVLVPNIIDYVEKTIFLGYMFTNDK